MGVGAVCNYQNGTRFSVELNPTIALTKPNEIGGAVILSLQEYVGFGRTTIFGSTVGVGGQF